MVQIGQNFGNKFLNTGKFGKKGKQQIKKAGFANVADFLNQAGVSQDSRLPQATIQNKLQTTANAGYQAPPPPATTDQDPVQSQNPTPPAQPSVGQGLMQQVTDLTNQGANILNNQNYQTGAQQDFGKVDAAAQAARAQGANILNTLNTQQQAADQDIQNFYNAQPLDTLRSNMAQMNALNQASGRTNSRSGNELSAELQRGLIRDQAGARLNSNNLYRQATVGEMGQQRALDQNLAGMYSGQGLGQGQLGNQSNQIGANIFNQGFNNQLNTLGFLNNLSMQHYNVQNQLLQKAYANSTAARQQREAMDLMQQQFEAQQQGGGFFSGMLGGLSRGLS